MMQKHIKFTWVNIADQHACPIYYLIFLFQGKGQIRKTLCVFRSQKYGSYLRSSL